MPKVSFFKEISAQYNLFSEEALKEASLPDRHRSPLQLDRLRCLVKLKQEWTPTTYKWASIINEGQSLYDPWSLDEDQSYKQLKKNFSTRVKNALKTDPLFRVISKKDKGLVLRNASKCCDATRREMLACAERKIGVFKKVIASLKKRDVHVYFALKSPPLLPNDYSCFVRNKVFSFLGEKYLFSELALSAKKGFPERNFLLNSMVHCSAEHMAWGLFGYGAHSVSISYLRGIFKKTFSSIPQELIRAFDFVAQINDSIEAKFLSYETRIAPTDTIARTIEQEVKNLLPGQCTIVPTGSMMHNTALYILCKGTDAIVGKKTYKAVQYNTGEGLEEYHYHRISDAGKKEYQRGLVFDNVCEDSLGSDFFNELLQAKMRETNEISVLYQVLFKHLLKTLQPPSTDERLWKRMQTGQSCSMQCLIALLKGEMPQEVYANIKEQAGHEVLQKAMEKIDAQDADTTARKIVALEVEKKLAAHVQKHTPNSPKMKELEHVRAMLEAHLPSTSIASLFDELYGATPLIKSHLTPFRFQKPTSEQGALSQVFSLIKDTAPSPKKRKEALRLMSMLLSKKYKRAASMNEYAIIALEIGEMIKYTPLTIEQISLLTAFTTLVHTKLQENPSCDSLSPSTVAFDRLKTLLPDFLRRYNDTKKPGDLKDAPDLLDEITKLNPPLPPTAPIAPPELQKEIEKE